MKNFKYRFWFIRSKRVVRAQAVLIFRIIRKMLRKSLQKHTVGNSKGLRESLKNYKKTKLHLPTGLIENCPK